MRRVLILSLLLLVPMLLPAGGYGQLEVSVWCELEPMIQENEEYPLAREEARRRVLEEAREILTAMIYGLEFSYTPADAARKTSEEFRLFPIAEIRWGDGQMRIAEAEIREKRLFARVYYDLEDFQSARRRAWESNTIPTATGSGEHSLFTASSPEGKRRSLEAALKDAIRNHLRPVLFNKPREIKGELLLWQEPQIIIASGAYLTRLKVKLQVKEIRPHSIF